MALAKDALADSRTKVAQWTSLPDATDDILKEVTDLIVIMREHKAGSQMGAKKVQGIIDTLLES